MHKNRAEMGYTCRMTDTIRLITTKAVAVPKISSTVRDLYGQAILSNIQRRTCSRHSSWTAWPLKMRSTGCRRFHFVYCYIIKSVSTNYMQKSPFSTGKLLKPTINYLPFKESEDESLCSKKVDRRTSPKSLQFTSHTLFIYSLSQYHPLTDAQISRTFRLSIHNLYVFLNSPMHVRRLSVLPFLSPSPQKQPGNSTNCVS
jgi:hypothetical protein